MLQKRPSDYPSVINAHAQSQSQPQRQQVQQHVGGRVDATTYRPPSHAALFAQRRADQLNFNPNPPQQQQQQQSPQAFAQNGRHDVVNRDIYSRNHALNAIPNENAIAHAQYQHQHNLQNIQNLQNVQNNQQQYHQQFRPIFEVQYQPQHQQQQQFQQQQHQPQPNLNNIYLNENYLRRPVPYTPFNQIAQQQQQQPLSQPQIQNRSFQTNYYQIAPNANNYRQFG